ncbi:MAG TPA: AAA family ATPase [Candidatus Binatia bacterium]|nr:AAA family ATPase [Candidatus Binatia bacterium]
MYAKHFGLVEPPFSVTPDPRFFYSNPLYREAFATLRYGIETRKGFIVITGEAGTGKTTLLRRLMRTVEETVHTAFVFNTHLDCAELLRLILTDLGIAHSARDRLTLMAQLNDYLIEQLHKDHIVSVLVDEAQDLSDEMLEELRLLSNLETDRAKLIQIVLMGQPELERKLDQPKLRQLKQRVAVRCRLAPLRSDEVAPYIHSRLQTVGYKGKELFDQGAVQKIALYSKGIPRLINVICDNALLIAYATAQSQVSAKIIDEVARDLQLLELPSVNELEEPKPAPRPERHDDEPWRSEDEKFLAAFEPTSSRLQPKRSWAGIGIGLVLAVIILASTVLYSQQSGSLAALGVNIDQLVSVPWKNPSPAKAPNTSKPDHVAQLPMNHLKVAAPQTAEPLAGNPTSNGTGDDARYSSQPKTVETQTSKTETAPTPAEPHNQSQTEAKPKPKERSPLPQTLRVFDASFVRDKPRSDANITGMLEPGTRIRVQSKTGEYFRVRSLDKDREPISGYVHREDAFFEPAK